MDEDEIFAYLRRNLKLNIKTDSDLGYENGDYGWVKYHTIQLLLEDVIISEESLS